MKDLANILICPGCKLEQSYEVGIPGFCPKCGRRVNTSRKRAAPGKGRAERALLQQQELFDQQGQPQDGPAPNQEEEYHR